MDNTMSIPPFPPQDLAKLVLGYLAEEQLMTAYDEFLQASPYLDAYRNEYDRIFMMSLKNILAEYRAVKIYVETCKPLGLRRKIFQCSSLLEVVKILVQNVDESQFQGTDRPSSNKQNILDKCDMCASMKLVRCLCKTRNSSTLTTTQNTDSVDNVTLENSVSVETTSLDDLPGNVTRKTGGKADKDAKVVFQCSSIEKSVEDSKQLQNVLPFVDHHNSSNTNVPLFNVNLNNSTGMLKLNTIASAESSRKIEEFNEILSKVCKSGSVNDNRQSISAENVNSGSKTISTSGTFHDFTTGIIGGDRKTCALPDSSTSENLQSGPPKVTNKLVNLLPKCSNSKSQKAQYLLHLANVQNVKAVMNKDPNLKLKPEDSKITILSDIKVDNFQSEKLKVPKVLKNATSTPLLQMQTIFINGTPAYKQKPEESTEYNYTKEEIMSMPTIILVPSDGAQVPSGDSTKSQVNQQSTKPPASTTARALGPLMIDVLPKNSAANLVQEKETQQTAASESNLSQVQPNKMVDFSKNASVPKDNITGSSKVTTPHILPPTRKSSSTPRRSSHVRVLDFTTPRRILHETIDEHRDDKHAPVEVVLSSSPNLSFVAASTEHVANETSVTSKLDSNRLNVPVNPVNENVNMSVVSHKKINWDADLRALAIANRKEDEPKSLILPRKARCKPTSRKSKQNDKAAKTQDENNEVNEKTQSVKKRRSSNSKGKNAKKKVSKENEYIHQKFVEADLPIPIEVPVKPTINIISRNDWNTPPSPGQNNSKKQNKSSSKDELDTPETERLSLQNAIDVKLNISELLETPYKQALYDIQMETPRFLGPDLPGDPLSDIKITNIPTPRFLNNTPKQPTPSSYCSRPTDYSSGGSYYKPDDQDYFPISDDLAYPVTSSTDTTNKKVEDIIDINVTQKSNTLKSGRPVRKCTKNVSYYSSPNLKQTNKIKEKLETASSCSDTISINSSQECSIIEKENTPKPRGKKPIQTKSDSKKKSCTKKRTPVRKESSKTFIKIKPRRLTPSKEGSVSRLVKETPYKSSKVKKVSSKEKNSSNNSTDVAVPTKSRRKSSTPRKIHCTKMFNSDGNSQQSTGESTSKKDTLHDSDTEHVPLRWSDEASQDVKSKTDTDPVQPDETEDISKIKEFIANSSRAFESEGSLQIDLINRGFDAETAKIIERDLLDSSPQVSSLNALRKPLDVLVKSDVPSNTTLVESDGGTTNELQVCPDEEDDEEIVLSVHNCNEDTNNFIFVHHDETKDTSKSSPIKLKDTFSMEVCIDDGEVVRLRAMPFNSLVDEEPQNVCKLDTRYQEMATTESQEETEAAVRSISNIEKLYTPIKESIRAECYAIFDSTLTSIDTPLKPDSPNIVLEVEKLEVKETTTETKKRKRIQSGNVSDDSIESKRTKSETQYLLTSANIQNIDIESVLSKLHGP